MTLTYKDQITRRINRFESDKVIIANDFLDITNYETIKSTLNRLADDGEIKRVMNGYYYKPKFSKSLREYEAPSIYQVAHAIARKYNWTIAPAGNTALNLLGLSSQVPATWTFISDGRYVDYQIGGTCLRFKRTSNKEISKMSESTSLVIQALKAIGNKNVTSKQINLLKSKLSRKQKDRLLEEGKTTSQWVYKIIREICEEE